MKALVTGCAGFIGSHLVDRLLTNGYEVVGFDNLSEGSLDNLPDKLHNIDFHKADLTNIRSMDKLFSGIDVVFHFAAQADVRKSLTNHRSDLNTNIIGTINVLELMLKYNVNNIVFASTGAIYGETKIQPIPETYSGIQNNLYATSKVACESYIESYTEFSKINTWIFRMSNPVGPRCKRGIVWDFVNKLLNNEKELLILGDGNQNKDYIHIMDCIDGIMTGYNNSHERVNIFNLTIDDSLLVNEIADIIINEMGLFSVKKIYSGGNKGWLGDIPMVHLDVSKLKKIGWNPVYTAREAVSADAKWVINFLT